MGRFEQNTEEKKYSESTEFNLYEGPVALTEWLDVSWFYPQGFEKEEVIETPRSLIVIGQSVVYKFIKGDLSAPPIHSFRVRWKAACEEILDNRELAPDLYLGLRLLRWVDGEPHWITEFRGKNLNPMSPPEGADEVVLVMRRVPEGSRFSSFIASDEGLSVEQISGVVKMLSKFHERRRRQGIRSFHDHPNSIIESIEAHSIKRLEDFLRVYENSLDPFSQLALQDIKTYMEQCLEQNRDSLILRGRTGYLVEKHGDLRARNICLEPLVAEGRTISAFSRALRADSVRRGDVLEDIASLIVDLEVLGAWRLAEEIERCYFSLNSDVYDKALYSFYLTSTAVQRAVELFQSGREAEAAQAAEFLALGFRYSVGLRGPFLIGIGGSSYEDCRSLARSLKESVSIQPLSEDDIVPGFSFPEPPEDFLFDKLLASVRRCLCEGSPVVVVWPLNRAEERLKLARLAVQLDIPYLLVKCSLSRHKQFDQGLEQLSPECERISPLGRRLWAKKRLPWANEGLSQTIRQTLVEPVLPQAELALYVIKELLRAEGRL